MASIIIEAEPHRSKLIEEATSNWTDADDLALSLIGNGICYEQYLKNAGSSRLELAFELLRESGLTNKPSDRVQRLASILGTRGGS